MNRNTFTIIVVALLCAGFIACHSGGGEGTIGEYLTDPTPTAAPTGTVTPQEAHNNECLNSIAGTWNYTTPTTSGTMTFDNNGAITAITIPSCKTLKFNGGDNATVEDGVVNITYYIKCKGIDYAYLMLVNFAKGTCSKMSGTKGFHGAKDENITLTRQ